MKKMRKVLALLLSLACVLSVIPQMDVSATADTETWEVTEVSEVAEAVEAAEAAEASVSTNVAAYKNNGKGYADNVTVTAGDVTFLNDGTYGNAWVAANTNVGVSAGVKLDKKYSIDTVRVVFKEGEEYDFTVSYYDTTRAAFVKLYEGTSYDEANVTDNKLTHKYYSEYKLENPVVTNDIKVTINSAAAGLTPTIAEIEAYGVEYDASKEPQNLSRGKTATASHVDWGRTPDRALDGDYDTYWDGAACGDNGQWMMVDLGEVCKLTDIFATTYVVGSRYYSYYIEVSTDGEEWTKVADRVETYGTEPAFQREAYELNEVEAQYVRVTVTDNNENHIAHMQELEIWGYPSVIRENVALGKTVSASNIDYGRSADVIVDGDYAAYWDGGSAPQSFIIDLGSSYFVDLMKSYPYTDGSRYYEYTIESSVTGTEFTELFKRTAEEGVATAGKEFKLEEPVEMRFVRVTMTYNSACITNPSNTSVHMKEFEVYGTINSDYQPPTEDMKDPENLAYGKTVRTHLATDSVKYINDGFDMTTCTGEFAPAYFDIDLEQNYDLSEIILNFPTRANGYYYYTIYGSVDGSNYDRLYQKRTQDPTTAAGDKIDLKALDLETTEYRIVRVYMEYASGSSSALLSEVRIHGTATGENTEDLRTGTIDEVLGIKHYSETEYAAPITEDETIENVYGIIERNIGAQYRDWFTFELAANTENENDYFVVSQAGGKFVITGNDGVSLASGLNYALQNFCNVQITEQTSQIAMPATVPVITQAVRCETPFAIRYAFNYCTLNYTFSYADAEEFQREYDWMALKGVNCVLDLAGQEAVWIKFLQNFDYTFDEAKDWIAGPTYYAWQFMQNMEVVGGPVSDEWIVGRLEMARENQRWKNSLGMQTVLQGYAGMIPCNFADYQPDVEILDQGTWCNLPRPDMIRTDIELYDQYAELFYAAQDWAFGPTSDYYAVDPFHEGGIRPEDLSDEVIAEEVLESLLKYDKDAVWMVQAWWSNPSNELLKGMGDLRQDHVIILDLTGLEAPKWNGTSYGSTKLDAVEFNGTDWVWCMLENYGGNPAMDGNLQAIIDQVDYAVNNSEHMKGIGFISEATYDNPAIYEMVFDVAWDVTETIDLDVWLDNYVEDRYGVESTSARKAWDILNETVYSHNGGGGSAPTWVGKEFAQRSVSVAPKLEKALALLFEDFDKLCGSESYMYDLTELMRQVVNNYATVQLGNVSKAYEAKDLESYRAEKEKFLYSMDLLEDVLGTQEDLMVGNWIGRAEDWAIDTGADDFAYDSMVINAKTLITVWAPSSNLGSYAYRNYQGMFDDIYKPLWKNFLDRHEQIMETGSTDIPVMDYTRTCMEWIYGDQDYERIADNSPENMRKVVSDVIENCSTDVKYPENEGNIALDKPVTANYERPDSPGAPGGGYVKNMNDGYPDTYWDGIDWSLVPEAVINLEGLYQIDRINVLCYVAGSREYYYDLYTSLDGEEWTLLVEKKEYGPETDAGTDFEVDLQTRYIKLIGRKNTANEGFHVKELRAYGTQLIDKLPLENVIESTAEYKEANYSAESWTAFQEAKAAAEAVLAAEAATQDQINAAKKALEKAIEDLELKLADYTAVNEAKAAAAALAKDNYKDFSAVEAAVAAVAEGKKITEQAEVDAMAAAINDAIAALELKDADYTAIEEALAIVEVLIESNYKDFSKVTEAVEAVEEGLKITEQARVNAFAKAITDAIKGLEYKDADYAEVNEAIAAANALVKTNYKDFSAVEAAINAVVEGKKITDQAEVDAYAKAIEDAIAALELKDADYTAVNAAIEAAEALVKANYKDFSKVERAVEAVVEGKKITDQAKVNAMAKAITDAIAALEYKDADYAAVNEAIAAANALVKTNYKDFSGVEAAIAAAVTGKDITEQAAVDAMAKAINEAIAALEYKDADYAQVNEAIAAANALVKTNYKDFSKVEAAIAAAVEGKNITEQAEVDAFAKAITDAIAALELKGADYTAVDAALAKVPEKLDVYTKETVAALQDVIKVIDRTLDITKQDEVDALAKAIEDAVAGLKKKPVPSQPIQPAPTTPSAPATGDTSMIFTWIAVAFVAAGCTFFRRRVK